MMLLAGIALIGCGTPPEKTVPESPKVEVGHPIARELTEEDQYNGWLEASAIVEVRSRVRGYIQKVHFKDGDNVAAGDILFELDPRPFEVQIAQSKANGRAFEAQKIAAQKELARYNELVKSGAVSRQEVEKVEADAASYDAQIAAKAEEVKQFELDLEYSKITAAIGGRISRAMMTEGNLVNAGGSDPLLTTIVAVDPVYIYFSVDERSLQRYMKARQDENDKLAPTPLREKKVPFRFGLDSDDGFPHEGLLDFADNRVNSDTGTIQVRGVAENDSGILVPGSRVQVRIPVSNPKMETLVPDTAILSDQDKRYVLIVDDKKVVLRRDIELGRLLDDGMRVVLPVSEGQPALRADEWIILEGLQRARIDYPVQPIEQPASPGA
jgi:RND family efflux transporter MFP subunit